MNAAPQSLSLTPSMLGSMPRSEAAAVRTGKVVPVTSARRLVRLLRESMQKPEMWRTGHGVARHVSGLELRYAHGLASFTENSDVHVPLGLRRRLALGTGLRRLFRSQAALLLSGGGDGRTAVQALCASLRDEAEAWEVFEEVVYHTRTGACLAIGHGPLGLRFAYESRLRFDWGLFDRLCVWSYVRRLILTRVHAKLRALEAAPWAGGTGR